MRFLSCVLLVASASAALAQQTTRIETRPYYGAVVTIEHGVRVYRPVPATRHMIIDPGAASANGSARTEPYGPVAPTPAVPRDR
jgi:hypothetical protein